MTEVERGREEERKENGLKRVTGAKNVKGEKELVNLLNECERVGLFTLCCNKGKREQQREYMKGTHAVWLLGPGRIKEVRVRSVRTYGRTKRRSKN